MFPENDPGYSTPVQHQQQLLTKFPGFPNNLWILMHLVETYNFPFDFKYDLQRRGWTFRIAGVTPIYQSKMVYFSQIGEAVEQAHNILRDILQKGDSAEIG